MFIEIQPNVIINSESIDQIQILKDDQNNSYAILFMRNGTQFNTDLPKDVLMKKLLKPSPVATMSEVRL